MVYNVFETDEGLELVAFDWNSESSSVIFLETTRLQIKPGEILTSHKVEILRQMFKQPHTINPLKPRGKPLNE